MFRTTFHNQVLTAIPTDVDPRTVIHLLHDHTFLIRMSPIVTRHSETHREGEKVTYAVWENVDILPFGLWRREISFTTAFRDQADGQLTWIDAPMHLTSQAQYTIRPVEERDLKSLDEDEAGATQYVLEESIETSCSVFLKLLVEMTMVPVRKKMHERVLERAREITSDVVANQR